MPRRAVDSRSSAPELLAQPAGALEVLAVRTGASFNHLLAARQTTKDRLASLGAELGTECEDPNFSVVLFGSWARMELTAHSDDDWAVLVATGDSTDPAVTGCVEVAAERLGQGSAKPGSQDVFGRPFVFE